MLNHFSLHISLWMKHCNVLQESIHESQQKSYVTKYAMGFVIVFPDGDFSNPK